MQIITGTGMSKLYCECCGQARVQTYISAKIKKNTTKARIRLACSSCGQCWTYTVPLNVYYQGEESMYAYLYTMQKKNSDEINRRKRLFFVYYKHVSSTIQKIQLPKIKSD